MLRQAINNTSGGGEHGVEAGFKMKDLCIKDRSNVGCVEDWSIWKLLPYLPLDCLQLCRRLPDRDLELEPGDRVKVVSGVRTHDLRGSFVIDRCPQLDLAVRVVEPLGKNAKDCVKSATLGSDAQTHDQNREDRKAGIARETANSESEIAEQQLEPLPTPGSAGLVPQCGGVAEAAERGAARFFRAHPRGKVLGGLPIEVELQFVLQLRAGALAVKQHLAPHEKFA